MDSNKFEDYSRVLLGKNAFLLFQVDKISNHALKQLHVMHSDVQCQKSFKLFKKFNEQSEYTSESHYATTYAHEVIEQFSLSENIVNAKSFKRKDY
jgi:histone deacetylase complex regulatory component SIN3